MRWKVVLGISVVLIGSADKIIDKMLPDAGKEKINQAIVYKTVTSEVERDIRELRAEFRERPELIDSINMKGGQKISEDYFVNSNIFVNKINDMYIRLDIVHQLTKETLEEISLRTEEKDRKEYAELINSYQSFKEKRLAYDAYVNKLNSFMSLELLRLRAEEEVLNKKTASSLQSQDVEKGSKYVLRHEKVDVVDFDAILKNAISYIKSVNNIMNLYSDHIAELNEKYKSESDRKDFWSWLVLIFSIAIGILVFLEGERGEGVNQVSSSS